MEPWERASRRVLSRTLTLAHGSGGRETAEIIEKIILAFIPDDLKRVEGGTGTDILDDSALIPVGEGYIAVTSDSYTVDPLFFPGGSIGVLAASGAINDLLMSGARPIAVLDDIIAVEGFPIETLSRVVYDFERVLVENRVALIGGDFKVVPKHEGPQLVIATTGIGYTEHPIIDTRIRDGDKIVVSGHVGDHGAAVLSARGAFGLKLEIKSDVKPLTDLMIPLHEKYHEYIHAAGDPTRGGLAMLLNEWAKKNGIAIAILEDAIPIHEEVKSYSELLGIDPLSLASEGVAVLAVEPSMADEIVEFMRSRGYRHATIIGEARSPRSEQYKGLVIARTSAGGYRIVEEPSGEIVPRIC